MPLAHFRRPGERTPGVLAASSSLDAASRVAGAARGDRSLGRDMAGIEALPRVLLLDRKRVLRCEGCPDVSALRKKIGVLLEGP